MPPPGEKSQPTDDPDRAAPPIDAWTRVSLPPKARISSRFAAPDRNWGRLQAGLAASASIALIVTMLLYAGQRTQSVRDAELERQQAEPTRSELRQRSGAAARAEFERRRAEAKAEIERRRAAAELQRPKGSSEQDRSGDGRGR